MHLTTRARQAVTAMLDLSMHQKAGPVALTRISRRRNISVSYLEQMFAELRRAGLVESTRGPGGGYELMRNPATITVLDIVRAVDRPLIATTASKRDTPASGDRQCLTPELWVALNRHVIEYLDSVSLKMLIDEQPIDSSGGHHAAMQETPQAQPRAEPSRPKAPNSVFQLGRFLSS